MTAAYLQPPRAPPDHLRLQSFQILSRLRLIYEFRPWLECTKYHVRRPHHTPLELLWDCFSFGAPLGTLLSLLGSPSPSHLSVHVDSFDFGIGINGREEHFKSVISRVQTLEIQGRLPYGEVLRCEDFLNGTNSAFTKVLQTVYRVLVALQETYPGLFVVPCKSAETRQELLQKLLTTEAEHVSLLRTVADATISLSEGLPVMEPCLECFLVNRARLIQYHDSLFSSIKGIVCQTVAEQWTRIFAFDDDVARTKIFSGYRSICVNYLGLMEFLQAGDFDPSLHHHAQILIEHFSVLLSRISEYCVILQDILDRTLPTDAQLYNSLCEAVFRMHDVSETMDEVGSQLRTIRSVRILKNRAFIWHAPDPDDMGVILLDDCIIVDPRKGIQYSVFLFETLLLCCREGFQIHSRQSDERQPSYPIKPWELGPALRRTTTLDIVYAIPTLALENVVCPDTGSMEIDWIDKDGTLQILNFFAMTPQQWNQWLLSLQPFVPPILQPLQTQWGVLTEEGDEILSEDEAPDGRRLTHAKSWSVIGRKGPHSESSSMINQSNDDDDTFLSSPGLLPTLFHNPVDGRRSPSPFLGERNRLPSPMKTCTDLESVSSSLPDLTGRITREGRYPSAHGGFSDVWKGIWHDGMNEQHVAVKVLRSNMGDPEMEEKMSRRLRRELEVWKQLNHPNVLELYGIASDFGHYSSMVCPWMENGSLCKYMERCGDIMSMADRLKFLCEVADGLAYLHSRSIVHGDLTGSNILITNEGKACLCDFGLSSIIIELQGTSYFTSTIGGAVRWADALFYRINPEEGQGKSKVGTWSDIYSCGSVMLEVLSGRVPYHYVRTDAQVVIELHKGIKPRRPAHSFVTDSQWSLIKSCWADDIDQRPDIEGFLRSIRVLHEEVVHLH